MKFFEAFKLDSWWKLILLLGVGAIFSSFVFVIDFIENKHLFGLGGGMFLIGLSYWMAERNISTIKPPNVYTGPAALVTIKETHHNLITTIILLFGLSFVLFFGFFIIKNLF